MKISEFPHQYANKVRASTNEKINKERALSSSRKETIRKGISKKTDSAGWGFGGAGIGFVVGFFACCGVCFENEEVGPALATWVGVTIVCAIIGVFIAGFINSNHDNSVENANNEVKHEESRCEDAIKKINKDAEHECDLYRTEFEAEAQKMSVRYAESKLATEVIDWMSKGFSKTIDASDRRSHIERIDAPFSFKVYPDKISCPLGTYDFEIKRCANLNSPLEQTAIARAIASSIRLNITMKYPKDASGTDYVLYISYTYEGNYVSASVLYTAPNGNYRPVQQW